MLEGIETGYEGKYDFPARAEPPELVYMLATVPRTGSSWFSHVLWQKGCLGAPLEYLNYEPAGPYGFAKNSASQQQWLWRSVLRRRTSPNGVFGIKCFPAQLQQLQETNPDLLSEVLSSVLAAPHPPRAVWLGRRDRVAHAISLARAIQSGVWRKEQETGDEPRFEYSEVAIEWAERHIEAQESAWQDMFGDLSIEPLRLWYEDALAAPEEAVRQVAEYLGVELSPDSAVSVPDVRKQSSADSENWAERYRRSKS